MFFFSTSQVTACWTYRLTKSTCSRVHGDEHCVPKLLRVEYIKTSLKFFIYSFLTVVYRIFKKRLLKNYFVFAYISETCKKLQGSLSRPENQTNIQLFDYLITTKVFGRVRCRVRCPPYLGDPKIITGGDSCIKGSTNIPAAFVAGDISTTSCDLKSSSEYV